MEKSIVKAIVNRCSQDELKAFVIKRLVESSDAENELSILFNTRNYPKIGEVIVKDGIEYTVKEVREFNDNIVTEYPVDETRYYKNEEDADNNSWNYQTSPTQDYPISRIVKATKCKYLTYKEYIQTISSL